MDAFSSNLSSVMKDINEACGRSGRSLHDVRLVAASKYLESQQIPSLMKLGILDFGENRWQLAREKLHSPWANQCTWHFIGRLQRNKVKSVVPAFAWIHSVDSFELGRAIDAAALEYSVKPSLLVQVNVSGESTKAGVLPDMLETLLLELNTLPHVSIRGLMTMAPSGCSNDEARDIFRLLKESRDHLSQKCTMAGFTELSMGMSDDFVVAIEEGATMVRIGRRLCGGTPK